MVWVVFGKLREQSMSTAHEHYTFIMLCDEPRCYTEYQESEDRGFDEFVKEARRAGWKIVNDGPGEWSHYCPRHAKQH